MAAADFPSRPFLGLGKSNGILRKNEKENETWRFFFGYLSLVAPFVFVYSFLSAIKEILHDGEKNLQHGVFAALSLFVIVFACVWC